MDFFVLFIEARKIVGAQMQHITYNEFLPIVLGIIYIYKIFSNENGSNNWIFWTGERVIEVFDLRLKKRGFYYGYNTSIQAMAANAFGTAAFRFGHSLIPKNLNRCNRFHQLLPYSKVFSTRRGEISCYNNFTWWMKGRLCGRSWWIRRPSTTSAPSTEFC